MKGLLLRRSDIAWTLIPLLLWWAGIHSRGVLIQPHCSDHPQQCIPANLLPMDRPAVGLEVPGADALSFTTQGLSGVVAISVPALWNASLAVAGRVSPLTALAATGTDLILLLQATSWNGLLTETAHLLSHRPRPFVYSDPVRARDFSNYTSFYSGHTSFAAVSTVFLVLTLAARGAPFWLLGLSSAGSYALVSLTGFYRILAGRHFPTDVLIAAIMGTLVAIMVARRHRPPT